MLKPTFGHPEAKVLHKVSCVQVKHPLVQGPANTLVGSLFPFGMHVLLVEMFSIVPRLAFPPA